METLLRRLAVAVGLLCGLIGAQGPEFAQQYRQRLAGAVDELSRMVARFDAEATAENLSPDKAIARLEANADPLAQARGHDMADDKVRLNRLKDALADLTVGGPVPRFVGFVQTFDAPTARRAWADFQPAVPTTVEAFVVAGLCWALGWAATHMVFWPVRRGYARARAGRPSPSNADG